MGSFPLRIEFLLLFENDYGEVILMKEQVNFNEDREQSFAYADRCDSLESHTKIAHDFGQTAQSGAQRATLIVALINFVTMFAEIFVGLYTGSMALLADGIHMGGHTLALGLASFAYYLSHKNSNNRNYSLGSGKINELAAFISGFFLLLTIFWLIFESSARLLNPEQILAKEALLVAIIGLVVNLVSVLILAKAEQPHHFHNDDDSSHSHHKDMNLRAALVHVFTDALTSFAAILGLIAAWLWNIWWIDSAVALVASFWILKWAWGLLRQTSDVLLDKEASGKMRKKIIAEIEKVEGSKLLDLHIWSLGQGTWTIIAVVLSSQENRPEVYKRQLKNLDFIHHPIIEIHFCPS